MKKNGILITVVFLLGLIALFAGIFVSQHLYFKKKIDQTQFHGAYLEKPRAVQDFSLMGTDNKPFENARLQGHWTLMFFGFTSCGSVCPTTMAELAKMYRILEQKGVSPLPQVVMVSVDPARDTLEKLGTYAQAFHPAFYGARGDEAAIQKLAHEMGIAYEKIPNKAGSEVKHYDIQHSGAVLLFNPKGELNAFFTTPHQADLLVKDYMLLVS